LQYRITNNDEPAKQHFELAYQPIDITKADSASRFAAAVAMFGSLLKQSQYVNDYNFEEVRTLARSAVDLTNVHQKEFLLLIDKAIKVYTPGKKKKG
jgi:hypothetical protein